MENDDILCKVVAAEKEIRQMVEDEEARSRELIERARKEAEEEVAQEQERLKASLAVAVEKARKDAEEKATAIKASARDRAERIGRIRDERLREIVIAHLDSILPLPPLRKTP
ncbi:MAG TPA: hypothetical protein VMH06_04690 [Thermodesulfovibrionales bacterium]|nr:hypothetical protein [Thermodesulfovibrionales bacterium]